MSRRKGRRKPQPTVEAAPAAQPTERLRPWLLGATVALFVARPLFPSETPAVTGDGLPAVMLWIVLAVVWMLGAIGRRGFSVRLGWIDGLVLALVAWHTLAALLATGHGSPRPAVNMLWEWIGLGLSYFLARQFIATRREARAVVVVMVGLGAALAVYGLYQTSVELPATRAAYHDDPDAALRAAGVWYPPGSPQRAAFENRVDSVEPLATFALTNSLAGYLAPWLIMAIGIAVLGADKRGSGVGSRGSGANGVSADGPHPAAARRPSPASGRAKDALRVWIGIGCCTVPMAVCLLVTKSRSAYLAALVGFAVLAAWWWLVRRRRSGSAAMGWRRPAAVLLAIVLLLGTAVVGATATGLLDVQIFSEATKSAGYRVQYWQATWKMIAEHPLFGCGPGNFQQEYTRYKLPEASEEVADPHNFLFEVWATAGTPAVLALSGVLAGFAWIVWRKRGDNTNDDSPGPANAPGDGLTATDRPWAALIGGACGFLLSIPLGALGEAPPGLTPVLVGLPVAAGCVALLLPWIESGRLPIALTALGVTVLLVNLLAAGGIGFAGVAGTFWLLVALGLNLADDGPPRVLPWSAAISGLVVALALAVACNSSAYGPSLRANAAVREAAQNSLLSEQLLAEAATADPLWAEPWRQLASLHFVRWLQRPIALEEELKKYEEASATALQLAPNSATLWAQTAGQWVLIAERLAGIDSPQADASRAERVARARRQAVEHYRRAVDLYPNSARYRAGLADALAAVGDREGFRREAREALRLDEATPHVEKKLPPATRQRLSGALSTP